MCVKRYKKNDSLMQDQEQWNTTEGRGRRGQTLVQLWVEG